MGSLTLIALDSGRLAPDHCDNHMIGNGSTLGATRVDDIADGRFGALHGLALVMVIVQMMVVLTASNENSPTKYSQGYPDSQCAIEDQIRRTFEDCGPLGPAETSKLTRSFSARDLNPSD